jgi:hypothetical protein
MGKGIYYNKKIEVGDKIMKKNNVLVNQNLKKPPNII